MILYLSKYDYFPVNVKLDGSQDKIEFENESVVTAKSIEIDIDIQQSGNEFFCQGSVIADLKLECARCLTEFDKNIQNKMDFIICDKEYHTSTEGDAIDTEDYVYYTGPEQKADLREIVRQTILLGLTMKPLCSEDCKGLCSSCSINLNISDCECDNEKVDPRWDALKNLKNSSL